MKKHPKKNTNTIKLTIKTINIMIKNLLILSISLARSLKANSRENKVELKTNMPGSKINRNIYGHFAEHLGRCIYDGFWVSDSLDVPKDGRIRMD